MPRRLEHCTLFFFPDTVYNRLYFNAACAQIQRGLSLPHEWMDIFVAFGNINLCLNPTIYAARYEMFKKSVRKMLNREIAPSAIAESNIWCVNISLRSLYVSRRLYCTYKRGMLSGGNALL